MQNKFPVGIAIAVSLALPLVCFGQDATTQASPQHEDQSLQLTIKSDKEIFRQGEKIRLPIIFKNADEREILLCTYFLEHKLLESLELRNSEGIVYKLFDTKKYELPIVTKDDFIPLTSNEEYKIELQFETIFTESSWLYKKRDYTSEGIQNLPAGVYQVKAIYENSTDYLQENIYEEDLGLLNTYVRPMKNVWTGTLTSNAITIEVAEKKNISKEEALKIAEEVCKKEGWEWVEVGIFDRETHWEVKTHYLQKGGNAIVLIDKKTGKILDKGWCMM